MEARSERSRKNMVVQLWNRTDFLASGDSQTQWDFITRDGDHLKHGPWDFVMVGPNINTLVMDFNNDGGFMANKPTNYIAPTEWRVDDVYATAQLMGSTAVRAIAVAMNSGLTGLLYPTLGGSFDETIFRRIDYAVARARDYRLRLIIPLQDWNAGYWWGDYTNFSNWGGTNFFTDSTAITNFKAYIAGIINRVNTVNGLRYGDDPTIMAWEIMNESNNQSSPWTLTISTYIKSLTNQLVIDGNCGNSRYTTNPNVDIFQNHAYGLTALKVTEPLTDTNLASKVFFMGEYDWNTQYEGDLTLAQYLALVETTPSVRGNMFYALASHGDLKGWPLSRNEYTGTSVPADASAPDAGYGDPAIQSDLDLIVAHHYAMRGKSVPAYPVCDAPTITGSTGTFQWRGVAGAVSYTIQKSATQNGTYADLATGLDDTDSPYTDAAGTAWYRIKAINRDGVAGAYSTPVQVTFE